MKLAFEVIVTNANAYGELHIHWDHTQQNLWISQALYVSQILKWFGFEHAAPVDTLADPNVQLEHSLVDVTSVGPFSYSQAVGCFMCAQIGNKPNISYDINIVAKVNHQPCIMELFAIFINTSLWGNVPLGLCYYGGLDPNILQAYSYVDFADDLSNKKSRSGFLFSMNGILILWDSRKQTIIASSTTKVEYVVANIVTWKIVWTWYMLMDLGF